MPTRAFVGTDLPGSGKLGVRRHLIGKIINLLREEAEPVSASALPNISPDPGDDPFCGCAEAGRADFIVTLNPKDFPQTLLSAHVIKPGEDVPSVGFSINGECKSAGVVRMCVFRTSLDPVQERFARGYKHR